MQTISDMQRDSIYKNYIKYLIIFFILVVYESITSIYPYLSPLFGVAFFYILDNLYNKDRFFAVILSFVYILIFEVDKGFIPLSSMIFFLIYYFFIYDAIEHIFSEKNVKKFFHVFTIYIGYYILNVILEYLFNYHISGFSLKYFLYIVTDFLILVAI